MPRLRESLRRWRHLHRLLQPPLRQGERRRWRGFPCRIRRRQLAFLAHPPAPRTRHICVVGWSPVQRLAGIEGDDEIRRFRLESRFPGRDNHKVLTYAPRLERLERISPVLIRQDPPSYVHRTGFNKLPTQGIRVAFDRGSTGRYNPPGMVGFRFPRCSGSPADRIRSM